MAAMAGSCSRCRRSSRSDSRIAAAACDVVGIARDGPQPVKRSVTECELSAEHPVHPAGNAQRAVIGQHLAAADQYRAVAARDAALLIAQDDVAAVSPSAGEE